MSYLFRKEHLYGLAQQSSVAQPAIPVDISFEWTPNETFVWADRPNLQVD